MDLHLRTSQRVGRVTKTLNSMISSKKGFAGLGTLMRLLGGTAACVNDAAHQADHGDMRVVAGGPHVETHEPIWPMSVCEKCPGNEGIGEGLDPVMQ